MVDGWGGCQRPDLDSPLLYRRKHRKRPIKERTDIKLKYQVYTWKTTSWTEGIVAETTTEDAAKAVVRLFKLDPSYTNVYYVARPA